MAVPTILCMLVVNVQQMVNLIFAGHLGDSSMIAAIGLGNLIQNIFIECIIWGFNGSVENMVSQAAGAGNLMNAGIYLNQGIFILVVAFLIILMLMFHIQDFLVLLHQNETVAMYTATYMILYFPALLIYGISDLLRKFLNSFRLSMIPFLSFTVSVTLHPLWTYLFIVKYGFGILGIAIAGLITNMTTFLLIKIFMSTRPQL